MDKHLIIEVITVSHMGIGRGLRGKTDKLQPLPKQPPGYWHSQTSTQSLTDVLIPTDII